MGVAMNKALFLDRDGVINADSGYVYKPEDFIFIDGIFDLCEAAQKQGFLIIVITNQAGIARGYYTEEDFHRINDWMLNEFIKNRIDVAAVYFCPFHPDEGVGEYRKDSFSRKPNPGMLFKARDDFGIDLSCSVLIGDKDSDIEAGYRAGIGRLVFLKGKYPCSITNDVSLFNSLSEVKDFIYG